MKKKILFFHILSRIICLEAELKSLNLLCSAFNSGRGRLTERERRREERKVAEAREEAPAHLCATIGCGCGHHLALWASFLRLPNPQKETIRNHWEFMVWVAVT